jgi:hypothetical protein
LNSESGSPEMMNRAMLGGRGPGSCELHVVGLRVPANTFHVAHMCGVD